MTKTPELLPCPFCDCQAEMTVDQFGYDETCCIISCVNLDMANKLADAVAEHFEVDLGETSNMNDPYGNALEWLEPVRALKNKGTFICGHCNARLGDWNYCPYCGQQLKWSDK